MLSYNQIKFYTENININIKNIFSGLFIFHLYVAVKHSIFIINFYYRIVLTSNDGLNKSININVA